MKPLRLALLGFGTVGQWLVEALHTQQAWLRQEFGLGVTLISVATAHHGLIYRSDGLDIPTFLEARVEPIALPLSDPLARIDGLLNAIAIQTDTPQEVTVIGPGAGRFQAGQGMLADLIAIARSQ
jgi:homoserine dehydrogenase